MENLIVESLYPLTFREDEAKDLGKHLKNRHNVVLIGMKRVGISNFLRFFLNHKDTLKTYIADSNNHIFIPVNLNDLVERETFPFWVLTLKRIADQVEKSNINVDVKKFIATEFLEGIQLGDLFLLFEAVRKSLLKIVESGFIPTLFLLRFDRISDVVTPEFFNNLQGLRDATHGKLSYVITSYRSLDQLSPSVFSRSALASFSHDMYIKPAKAQDLQIILKTYVDVYKLKLSFDYQKELFRIVDGYTQYLQLSLIYLHEQKSLPKKEDLYQALASDERINLQSEELWDYLTETEQEVLNKIIKSKKLTQGDKNSAKYLIDTGFINENKGTYQIFSPLFEYFLKQRTKKEVLESSVELSKKEFTLFEFLKLNLETVCDRERIIESVWPEVDSLGVTDWAIDRLIARLRNKLKMQKTPYEVITIKTRGYKLTAI